MAETRPVFVVLDGIDGCGKTTQARRLTQALAARRGREPLHLREPGSTALGERIRGLLLDRALEVPAPAEVLLFVAARRTLLDQVVAPALAGGQDVVCERFHASTFAYQAVAGGLDERRVLDLLHAWAGRPEPDLTLILDLDPRIALERRSQPGDRIEDRGFEFQKLVARGYRRFAELEPRVELVPAQADTETVAARVLERVERLLAEVALRV